MDAWAGWVGGWMWVDGYVWVDVGGVERTDRRAVVMATRRKVR